MPAFAPVVYQLFPVSWKTFNLCFQDHYRGDSRKGIGPVRSMGYLATARIVKISNN